MSEPIVVTIVGAPVACVDGIKDSWREVAAWVAGQLERNFGKSVEVVYYDLFEPACPAIPQNAQLPLVLVGGEILTSGQKISVPVIRKFIEARGFSEN